MAKIRAKTKDWLAVSITTNRKTTNRQGRNRGEGFRRYGCIDGVTLREKEGGRENKLEGREEREEKEETKEGQAREEIEDNFSPVWCQTTAGTKLIHLVGR